MLRALPFQCQVLVISTLFHALTNLQEFCLVQGEVLCQKRQAALQASGGRKTPSVFSAAPSQCVQREILVQDSLSVRAHRLVQTSPLVWQRSQLWAPLLKICLLAKSFVQGTWLLQSTFRSRHQPVLPSLWSQWGFSRWPN